MPKLGAVINCLNEADLIGGCLDLLEDVEKVVVISSKSYSGLDILEYDDSPEIARKHGAHVIFTDTHNQSEMRNLGLAYLQKKGCDYNMIVDADEWWTKEALAKLRVALESGHKGYKTKLTHMFKQPNWSVPSPGDRGTIVAMRSDQRLDPDQRRDFTEDTILVEAGPVYHFSYVRTPDRIKAKIKNFSHAHEVIPGWFENVFLPCTETSRDVHPTSPGAWSTIVPVELPEEIASKIPKHLW